MQNKRLLKEYKNLQQEPTPYIIARPKENNLLECFYVITGPEESPYHNGEYFGCISFPKDYPFAPPSIRMITPNGRFQVNYRLCLSMSDYHPGSWNPAWSVSTILNGLLSFMLEQTPTTGSIETTPAEKRNLARRSHGYNLTNKSFRDTFPDLCVARDEMVEEEKVQVVRERSVGGARVRRDRTTSYRSVFFALIGLALYAFINRLFNLGDLLMMERTHKIQLARERLERYRKKSFDQQEVTVEQRVESLPSPKPQSTYIPPSPVQLNNSPSTMESSLNMGKSFLGGLFTALESAITQQPDALPVSDQPSAQPVFNESPDGFEAQALFSTHPTPNLHHSHLHTDLNSDNPTYTTQTHDFTADVMQQHNNQVYGYSQNQYSQEQPYQVDNSTYQNQYAAYNEQAGYQQEHYYQQNEYAPQYLFDEVAGQYYDSKTGEYYNPEQDQQQNQQYEGGEYEQAVYSEQREGYQQSGYQQFNDEQQSSFVNPTLNAFASVVEYPLVDHPVVLEPAIQVAQAVPETLEQLSAKYAARMAEDAGKPKAPRFARQSHVENSQTPAFFIAPAEINHSIAASPVPLEQHPEPLEQALPSVADPIDDKWYSNWIKKVGDFVTDDAPLADAYVPFSSTSPVAQSTSHNESPLGLSLIQDDNVDEAVSPLRPEDIAGVSHFSEHSQQYSYGHHNAKPTRIIDNVQPTQFDSDARRYEKELQVTALQQDYADKFDQLRQIQDTIELREHAVTFVEQESEMLKSAQANLDCERRILREREVVVEDKDLALNQQQIELNEAQRDVRCAENELKVGLESHHRQTKELQVRERDVRQKDIENQAKARNLDDKEISIANIQFQLDEQILLADTKRTFTDNEERRVTTLLEQVNHDRKSLHELELSLFKQKNAVDQQDKSLCERESVLHTKMTRVDEQDREMQRDIVRIQAESARLESMSVEVARLRDQLLTEREPLMMLKGEVEAREAQLLKIEHAVKGESARVEERCMLMKKSVEQVRECEADVASRESDLRSQLKFFSDEKARFESHQSNYDKEKRFLADRGVKVDAALIELRQKQAQLQDEQKRAQHTANANERSRLDLERERSSMLEREAEMCRRMESMLPSNSTSHHLILFKQQLDASKQTFEKERRDLVQRRTDIQRLDRDLAKRHDAFTVESNNLVDSTRQLQSQKVLLQNKENQMATLMVDLSKQKQDIEARKITMQSDSELISRESQLLQSNTVRFNEDRVKLKSVIEMKLKGSDMDALKSLILEEYMGTLRDKDMHIRQQQDAHQVKTRQLEDEIYTLKKNQNQSEYGSRRGSQLGRESDVNETDHGGLSQSQVRQMNDLAVKQIQTADLEGMMENKDKFDLLNMIVVLTNTNKTLTQKMERSSNLTFDQGSISGINLDYTSPYISHSRPQSRQHSRPPSRPLSAFGNHPTSHTQPRTLPTNLIQPRTESLRDSSRDSRAPNRRSFDMPSMSGRDQSYRQEQRQDPRGVVSELQERIQRGRMPEARMSNILRGSAAKEPHASLFNQDTNGLSDLARDILKSG